MGVWARTTRGHEPAQKVETVSVPLGGGTPQVVRVGIRPAPSDDGKLLALLSAGPVSLEVLDPRGGIHHTYAVPPASGKGDVVSYAWQRGSQRLLAIDIGLTIDSCSDSPVPPPSSCASPPTLPTTVWSLDTSAAATTWRPIRPSRSLPTWRGIRLIGPGRLPGSVVAEQDLPGSSQAIAVLTVSQSGTVIDRVPLAPNTSILSADQSGTNFLVTYPGGLGRMSLHDPTPIHIADAVRQASW
jgi:hypothetical protein